MRMKEAELLFNINNYFKKSKYHPTMPCNKDNFKFVLALVIELLRIVADHLKTERSDMSDN